MAKQWFRNVLTGRVEVVESGSARASVLEQTKYEDDPDDSSSRAALYEDVTPSGGNGGNGGNGSDVPFVGATAPSSPTNGELWWDTDDDTPVSGGASSLLQHDFTLTAAQIKASAETPAIIVPAPGANKMLSPVNYVFALTFNGVPYSAGPMYLWMGDTDLGLLTTFLDQTQDFLAWAISATTGATWEGAARADFVNQPLRIQANLNGSIVTSIVADPGAGYAPGDTGTVDDGSPNATYRVDTVGGGGAVLTYTIISGGDGYVGRVTLWTTTPGGSQPGGGSGLTITVDTVDASGAAGDSTIAGSVYYIAADV